MFTKLHWGHVGALVETPYRKEGIIVIDILAYCRAHFPEDNNRHLSNKTSSQNFARRSTDPANQKFPSRF